MVPKADIRKNNTPEDFDALWMRGDGKPIAVRKRGGAAAHASAPSTHHPGSSPHVP